MLRNAQDHTDARSHHHGGTVAQYWTFPQHFFIVKKVVNTKMA
jgi:hypothetical protein